MRTGWIFEVGRAALNLNGFLTLWPWESQSISELEGKRHKAYDSRTMGPRGETGAIVIATCVN